MAKKVALYCRVSTKEQTTDNQTLDLKRFCGHRDLEIVQEYSDHGISGSKDSRPALNQMLEDAKAGKFEVLLVWKLDRLGRSLKHLIYLLNELHKYNVSFISMQENIDLTSPTGRLVFQMLGAIGEFELSLIKSRVNAGIRRAREQNIKLGRPKMQFDYDLAIQLRRNGLGFKEIAKKLGVSVGKIHQFIKSAGIQKTLIIENLVN